MNEEEILEETEPMVITVFFNMFIKVVKIDKKPVIPFVISTVPIITPL